MNYFETLQYIAERGNEMPVPGAPRRKFTLEHIRSLLKEIGSPQQNFSSVLIAGTNGKGSTAATLASIAAAAGVRVGLYTSPHLLRVNERMRLADGSGGLVEVDEAAFAAVMTRVRVGGGKARSK